MALASRPMAGLKGKGADLKPSRILCVRFCAIGDCVMAAWAVTAIRLAYPHAHLVWAVEDTCIDVVDDQGLVNASVKADKAAWRKNRWSATQWYSQIRHFSALRRHGFDLGFDFQAHSKTALCLKLSGAATRFSHLATDGFAARLNTQVDTNRGQRHDVEAHLALVSEALPVTIPDRCIMPTHDCIVEPGAIVIQTGASRTEKTYPRHLWQQVALRLVAKGHRVVTIGGQHDPDLDLPGVQDLVGKLTLRQALGVVRTASHHIAADTGTGHAAAAYGVPVTSVFGSTRPDRFRPYGRHVRVLQGGEEPSDVTPDEIVEAVLSHRVPCAS